MRALVTRPKEDAEGIAEELRRRGLEVMVEPLLRILPVEGARVDLAGVQALLVTSANGARAFAAVSTERRLPVLAVGDASARAARELGFVSVESAEGDVESLIALVRRLLDPGGGALFHAAGSVVAGDLAGRLAEAGYSVRRQVLYEARAAAAVSDGLRAAMEGGAIGLALFFSPRTAATFATLVTKAGMAPACAAVTAYCLSAAVEKELARLPWRAVRVADRPEQRSLLAAIDQDMQIGHRNSAEGEARA